MKKLYLSLLFYAILAFKVLIPGHTHAQAGPGGIDKTNLKVWLKADTGVFLDNGITPVTNGGLVYRWNDQSGNNLHAVKTIETYRPLYKSSEPILNGRPTLYFDGNIIDIPFDISPGVTPDITVIVVATHNTATATTGSHLFGHDNGGWDRLVGFDSRNGITTLSHFTNNANGSGAPSDDVGPFANPEANTGLIITSRYTPDLFSGWLNGKSMITDNPVSNGEGKAILSIGNTTSDVGAPFFVDYWRGNVAEFMVFDRILTEAERIVIENYLSAKYGTALSFDFYTMDNVENGNFDYDVSGIGQAEDGSSVVSAASGFITIHSPSALENNEYLFFGHDNAGLNTTINDVPAGVAARFERVWRVSETGNPGTVNMDFDLANFTITNPAELRLLIDRNNNGSFDDETTAGGGIISNAVKTGTVYSFIGVDLGDGQRFTLAATTLSALPVTVSGFTVRKEGTGNLLLWKTESEINADHFGIERSADGISFSTIGSVKAAGTSTSVKEYSFTDKEKVPGDLYYRLKMIDLYGRFDFSDIVKLAGLNQSHLRVAPNPVSGTLTISGMNGNRTQIRLLDASGKLSGEYYTNDRQFTIDMSGKMKGIYYIRIQSGNKALVRSIIKN